MWEGTVRKDLFKIKIEEAKIRGGKVVVKLRFPQEAEVELDLPEFEKILSEKIPLAVEAKTMELTGDAELVFSSPHPMAHRLRSLYNCYIATKNMIQSASPEEFELLVEFLTAAGEISRLKEAPKELWPKIAKARLMREDRRRLLKTNWYVRKSHSEPFQCPEWQDRRNYFAATVLRKLTAWFPKSFERHRFRDSFEGTIELWLCDDDLPVLLANLMADKRLFHKKDLLPIAEALDAGDVEKAKALILSRAFWR